MSIREKINYLTALEHVLNHVDGMLCDNMRYKTDEDGNYIKDENGDFIQVPPELGDYTYNMYVGLLAVRKDIEKLSAKV